MDNVRVRLGLDDWTCGGEEERIPVLDVGIGVGYLRKAFDGLTSPRACRFKGLGRPGEDSSKGGSKVGAGRFTPRGPRVSKEMGGREGSPSPVCSIDLRGEELIVSGS